MLSACSSSSSQRLTLVAGTSMAVSRAGGSGRWGLAVVLGQAAPDVVSSLGVGRARGGGGSLAVGVLQPDRA